MKSIRKTFICEKNEDFDCLGFKPEGDSSEMFAGTGIVVAHDVLEHFPGRYQGVHDEYRAFGAMLFVRQAMNWVWSDNTHYEIMEMLVRHEELCMPAIKRTRRIDDKYVEDEIDSGLRKAKQTLAATGWDSHPPPPWYMTQIKEYIKLGLRQACRRYEKVPTYDLAYHFESIQKRVNESLNYAEEGLRIAVEFSPKNNHSQVLDLGFIWEDDDAYF